MSLPSAGRRSLTSATVAAVLALALSAAACDQADGVVDASGEQQPLAAADRSEPHASFDGTSITVTDADGTGRTVAEHGEEDGELLHVALRPGGEDPAVVLALFRVEDVDVPQLGARYELRYLLVDEGGATSDLYWFPWRMQIDARVVEVADVPPSPVWAPDGSALAWIEWNGDATTLRLVGWHSGVESNPSDAVGAYRLEDIEPGTQLLAWHDAERPVLSAVGPDGERLEIELDVVDLAMARSRT